MVCVFQGASAANYGKTTALHRFLFMHGSFANNRKLRSIRNTGDDTPRSAKCRDLENVEPRYCFLNQCLKFFVNNVVFNHYLIFLHLAGEARAP